MLIIRYIQEHCVVNTYEVPIPSKLMCGKKEMDELEPDEWDLLLDYIHEHAGDYLVREDISDRDPWYNLSLKGPCPKEKCEQCRARVECLVDLDAKEPCKEKT